jgi:hypothetical protein
VFAAVLLAACSRGESLGRLEKSPEASLRYPGSTQVSVTPHKAGPAPENPAKRSPPYLLTRSEARAAGSDVVAFFRDALTTRGWHQDPDGNGPAIGVFAAERWLKGDRVFAFHLSHGAHGVTVVYTTLTYDDDD